MSSCKLLLFRSIISQHESRRVDSPVFVHHFSIHPGLVPGLLVSTQPELFLFCRHARLPTEFSLFSFFFVLFCPFGFRASSEHHHHQRIFAAFGCVTLFSSRYGLDLTHSSLLFFVCVSPRPLSRVEWVGT